MSRTILFFLGFCIVIAPTAHAEDKGIFNVLDEGYIDNIADLPYSSGVPDQTVQASGHIRGWIDIVGFDEMVRDDGVDYLNDNPVNKAIVQYGAGHGNLCSRIVSGYCGQSCYWCFFYSLCDSISTYQQGDKTVARLDVTLYWHETVVSSGSSQTFYYADYATFYDYETSPQVYQPLSEQFKVNVTQYNTSLYENIGIRVYAHGGIGKTVVKYGANTSTHITKIGHVEQTAKGVYFANMTAVNYWNVSGFGKINDELYFNGNLSKVALADIKVTGSNLYESMTANPAQYSTSRVEFTPEKELTNTLLFGVLGVLTVIAWGICFLINRVMMTW